MASTVPNAGTRFSDEAPLVDMIGAEAIAAPVAELAKPVNGGDAGEKPEVAKVTKPPVQSEEELRAELAELKKHLAQQQEATRAAERTAREQQTRAGRSELDARSSAITMLDNAIQARNAAKEALRRDYVAARESGDYAKEAEVNDKLSRLNAELVTLEQGKQQAEAEFKAQQDAAKRPQPQQFASPVDEFLARTGIRGRSERWIRRNPQVVENPDRLAAIHQDSLSQGIEPESDAYFEFFERKLGMRKDEPVNGHSHDTREEERQPRHALAAVSAPPSRRNTRVSGANDDHVDMTPEMRKAAQIAGVSDEVYAKNWLAARKQGLIER